MASSRIRSGSFILQIWIASVPFLAILTFRLLFWRQLVMATRSAWLSSTTSTLYSTCTCWISSWSRSCSNSRWKSIASSDDSKIFDFSASIGALGAVISISLAQSANTSLPKLALLPLSECAISIMFFRSLSSAADDNPASLFGNSEIKISSMRTTAPCPTEERSRWNCNSSILDEYTRWLDAGSCWMIGNSCVVRALISLVLSSTSRDCSISAGLLFVLAHLSNILFTDSMDSGLGK